MVRAVGKRFLLGRGLRAAVALSVVLWASHAPAGLISYWAFDDGSGTTAVNAVPGGAPAQLYGPTWTTGHSGAGLSFDGVNDYALSGDLRPPIAAASGSTTLSVWFNAAAPGVVATELGQTTINTGWHDSQIEVLSNGEVRARVWALGSVLLGNITINDGQWHNAVLTYNSTGAVLDGYLDNVNPAGATAGTPRQLPPSNLYYALGPTDTTRLDTGAYFNGRIDDVAVWNEVLSPSRVAAIAAGTPFLSTWTDGTGAWESAANWSTNPIVPGPNQDAYVDNGGTAQITALTGTANPASLTVGGTAGGTVSLNGGTLSTAALNVGAGGKLTVIAGTLSVPGVRLSGGTASVEFANTAAQAYSVPITGDGSVTKTAAGVLSLGGVNSYTGATTISDGTLQIANTNPYTPASGAAIWLDAADPNPAHFTMNGSNVAAWYDQSGNGSSVSQSNADRQPTLVAGQINGLPVVRFSTASPAADQLFNTTNYASPVTVFSVSRLTGGANYRLMTSYTNNWLLGYWGGGIDKAHFDAWVNNPGTTADTRLHLYEAVIRGGTSNSDVYVFDSRNPGIMLLASNGGGRNGPNGLALGGWQSGVTEASNGDVAEVLIFSGVLTDAQREATAKYLMAKWYNYTDVIPDTSPVSIAPTATLDLNNCMETIGPLSGAGSVLLGTGTLGINSTADSAFSGTISGAGNLAKYGAGKQTLSGAITYTGATTVDQGELDLGAASNVGSAGSPVYVGSWGGLSGTLTLGGGSLAASSITLGETGTGTLNVGGTASVTANQNTGYGGVVLGLYGNGTVNQTGGTVTANNGYVILGRYGSSVGTYNISAGTLQTAGSSGDRNIYLGWDSSTATGALNLSGTGQVNAVANLNVAANGIGTVNQTGGAVTVAGQLRMAENAAGRATWNLSGGTVTVNNNQDAYIGVNGLTNFNVTGPTAALTLNGGRLEVGYNARGTITQTDGTVMVNNSHIVMGRGANAVATYNISGGVLKTAGTSGNRRMHMAWDNAASKAYLNLSGNGQIIVNADNVNGSPGAAFLAGEQGTAEINISGNGSLTVYGYGDNEGAMSLARNGNARVTVNQTGGTVTLYDNHFIMGRNGTSQGTYNISGGVLKTAGTLAGANRRFHLAWDSVNSRAVMNVSGSGQVIANADNASGNGAFFVANQGTAELNVSGNGSVTVFAGADSEGAMSIGRDGNSVGTVNQTGGTVTLNNNYLIAGRYNNGQGTYNISGGVLKTAGATGNRRMHFGWDSANARGTMNISGTGQVIVNADNVNGSQGAGFILGYNGTGTLSVADSGSLTIYAGGDTAYGGMAVAHNGGTSSVTQTGGTVTVYDNYLMLGRYNAAQGTYDISGGTLSVIGSSGDRSMYLGWDSANAKGYFNVGGTANATIAQNLNIGGNGTAAVTMTGGSLTVGGTVQLARNASSNGTLSLNGGVLTASGLAKGLGTAALGFDGGTLRAGGSFNTSVPAAIGAGGATVDTNGNDVTWVAPFSGAGALTKTGAGILTLRATNTYGGATAINGGTLRLANSQLPSGAAGYYSFDNVSGALVRNDGSAGSTYDGTLTNGAAIAAGGMRGDAMSLPAGNAELLLGGGGLPLTSAPPNDWTISAWYYNLAPSGAWRTLTRANGGDNSHQVIIQDSSQYLGAYYGGFRSSAFDMTYSTGSWHQVTAVATGGTTAFYIDGVRVGNSIAYQSNANVYAVGNYQGGGQRFSDLLDEVYIYQRALSADEVLALFNYNPGANIIPDLSPVTIGPSGTLDLNDISETIGSLEGGGNVLLGSGTLTTGGNGGSTTFSGPIAGSGNLVKQGGGVFTLSGTSSYTGSTSVAAGTLLVNGSIASSSGVAVSPGATLGGYGAVPVVSGAGLVSPGTSPGILTAAAVDPTGGLDFAFEFGATGSPSYGTPAASVNDVLRLSNASVPFTAALDADNQVDVYLGVTDLELGDTFRGGFYTDRSTDFLAEIQDADMNIFVLGDGNGTHSFNGVNYYTFEEFGKIPAMNLSTVFERAGFLGGDASGYVMQLTAVPEPSALLLAALGLVSLVASTRLRRRKL